MNVIKAGRAGITPARGGRRLPRVVTALLTAAAALTLSACSAGDVHPGNAAVVDGTAISQGTVDDVTDAFCAYTADLRKQSSQYSKLGIADLRSSLTSSLVQFEITRNVADQLGLSASDAQIDSIAAQYTLPDTLNESDTAVLTTFFDDFAEAAILQAVIGAHLQDPTVTNADGLSQDAIQGQKPYMKKYFEAADVDLNPSYGTWNGASIDAGTGSLSDLVSSSGKSTDLSDAEQCG